MLTIHHLGRSQSERILWLCEELGLPYDLRLYARDPVTILAPPELQALHPIGAAPIIEDNEVVLAESGAIVEYIIRPPRRRPAHAGAVAPGLSRISLLVHFANGTLQPVMGRAMIIRRAGLPTEHPVAAFVAGRLQRAWSLVEARLGEAAWFAGDFTAADIMMVFSLTTMRFFMPVELAPYPNVRTYLQRVGEREAYRRAMAKGDPAIEPLLT